MVPTSVSATDSTDPSELYLVHKNEQPQQAHILYRRRGEVYVHYVNTDKRLDEWLPEEDLRPAGDHEASIMANNGTSRKRKRGSATNGKEATSPATGAESDLQDGEEGRTSLTEEEYDIQHHKQITAKRNFDKVNFGRWQIKTWYFSPYPLTESEAEDQVSAPTSLDPPSAARIQGVSRSSLRAHGRTSDLFAGGLGRTHGSGEKSTLWVCDKCFKYMAEGLSWELHMRNCTRKHPPGRKVYQRGAHIIWEVDGAKDKLYCQNLSLFGKLFIDIKTLFFDCDNFLFYILTDADSQRDHVLGFFSKEKISYDDYNLACIVVFPPYQKKGYGMLMIEFSYELSRRAGKVGTPERPLSDLGLRSYLTYWVSTLVRFLRRLLSVLPPETPKIVLEGGVPELAESFLRSPSREPESGTLSSRTKRRKSVKGWDGEVGLAALRTAQMTDETDSIYTTLRSIEAIPNPDGSVTVHVVVRCTLADLARATNLRIEDTAFALNECGLLSGRHTADGKTDGEDIFVMTREIVETVARERNVKRMCMDLVHVLL